MRRKLFELYRDIKHGSFGVPYLSVDANDCFLTSFPRSGNTWMRYMLLYALYPDRTWDIDSIEAIMPIVDRPDLKAILRNREDAQYYRMFKSHDAYREYFLKGRVVYIIRDGRDAVSSYYHYRANMNEWKIDFSQYLANSLAGRYRYGSWHEHVQSWWEHRQHPNLKILRYERILEQPAEAVAEVFEHFQINVTDEAIQAAVQRASVEHVSKGFAQYASKNNRRFTGGTGGGSGKWQKRFSEEDRRKFDQTAGNLLRELGYE